MALPDLDISDNFAVPRPHHRVYLDDLWLMLIYLNKIFSSFVIIGDNALNPISELMLRRTGLCTSDLLQK